MAGSSSLSGKIFIPKMFLFLQNGEYFLPQIVENNFQKLSTQKVISNNILMETIVLTVYFIFRYAILIM